MARYDYFDRYELGFNASAAQRQAMDEVAEARLTMPAADAALPALLSDTLVAVYGFERLEANERAAWLISDIDIFPGTDRAAEAIREIHTILSR